MWHGSYYRWALSVVHSRYVVVTLSQYFNIVRLACRTTATGEKTVHQIRRSGVTSGRVSVYKLDNSSFESVREFAQNIKKDYDKIHILINNGMSAIRKKMTIRSFVNKCNSYGRHKTASCSFTFQLALCSFRIEKRKTASKNNGE